MPDGRTATIRTDARGGGDVGRRGLVRGGGAAGRVRPRRGRRVDAALRPARGRELRHLLLARRPARRPSRGRRARRSPLHPELRAPVRGDGRRQLRPGVHRRPHAPALRALQQRPEVLDAARSRERPRRRAGRHRPLRARRDRRRTAAGCCRRGAGPGQGPVLLSVLADAGAAGAGRRFPSARCRRPRCASTRGAWASASPTSPTARRSASCPTATTPRSSSRRRRTTSGRAGSPTPQDRTLGTHDGIHRFTIGPAEGAGRLRRRCRCTSCASTPRAAR